MTDDWRDSALCAQVDPELFFPASGWPGQYQERQALSTCAACDVLAQCREDALSRSDAGYGVLGGLTAHDRRRMIKRKESS